MPALSANERLERTSWDTFWIPDDVSLLDTPEILALRSDRSVAYLNSVYRHRIARQNVAKAVADVKAFHGTVSCWQISDVVDTSALEKELERVGYLLQHEHDARTVYIDDFVPRSSSELTVKRVDCEEILRDCWQVSDEAFGRVTERGDSDAATELALCKDGNARIQRFVVYREGEPLASGGLNLFPDLRFGFLWAGGTVPHARGQGVYSTLVAARIEYAKRRNLEIAGLYARIDSSSPIVAAQGFGICGHMNQWTRGL